MLARRGVDAWVFRGDDGLDELTTTTTSQAWLVHDGIVTPATVDPAALGIAPSRPADLVGGDVSHNADVVRRTLDGETGPVRDAVLLNAAAALAVYDAPCGARRRGAAPRAGAGGRGRRQRCRRRCAHALGRGLSRLSRTPARRPGRRTAT